MSGFPIEKFVDFLTPLLSANVKVMAVASSETINLATVEFIADITLAARLASSANLASKSVAGGVFDAADVTITIPDGEECGSLVYYEDTGDVATDKIWFVDTTSTNLPTTGNGAAVSVGFDAAGIFSLANS